MSYASTKHSATQELIGYCVRKGDKRREGDYLADVEPGVPARLAWSPKAAHRAIGTRQDALGWAKSFRSARIVKVWRRPTLGYRALLAAYHAEASS
jgi:hypothetical protein